MINIPVSVGELFDKVSILELKLHKIDDENKLINIKKEYDFLREIALNLDADFQSQNLYKLLYKINEHLWDIEENKRSHEAKKDFGDTFIHWARQVYIKNDERARLKREINQLYGSEIVEEKSYKPY